MAEEEKKPTFEERLARLDQIVKKVEGNTLPLEEAMALFEEGVKLQKELIAELSLAQAKIEELTGESEDK